MVVERKPDIEVVIEFEDESTCVDRLPIVAVELVANG